MAELYGLDPHRISSHSLRIGGATSMAAAGMSEYEIKLMGGWKSDVFLEYKLAKRTFTIQLLGALIQDVRT